MVHKGRSLPSDSLPTHVQPQLQLHGEPVHQGEGVKSPKELLYSDEAPPPLSMAEMVTIQGGQVSDNALWDVPHRALTAPAGSYLSIASARTTRSQKLESQVSQSTQKGILSVDTTTKTLLLESNASQPCACLKGSARRTLNWSLALRVNEHADVHCLPLASLPQQQPDTYSMSLNLAVDTDL